MLELIALILAGIHFGVPLASYYYTKHKGKNNKHETHHASSSSLS
jgi:hypothetical protein